MLIYTVWDMIQSQYLWKKEGMLTIFVYECRIQNSKILETWTWISEVKKRQGSGTATTWYGNGSNHVSCFCDCAQSSTSHFPLSLTRFHLTQLQTLTNSPLPKKLHSPLSLAVTAPNAPIRRFRRTRHRRLRRIRGRRFRWPPFRELRHSNRR